MKRFLPFAAVLLSAVSCKVDEGEDFMVTDDTLINYGRTVLSSYILPGAEYMVLMLDVDEYLSLPPEEQEKSRLHGKVFPGEGNTFVYSAEGEDYLDFYEGTVIDTGGKSIMETGAEWSAENFYGIDGLYYYSGAYMDATFKCEGEGSWSVKARIEEFGVEMQLDFTGMSKIDSTYAGTLEVSGKETAGNGYVSEFSSVDGPCTYVYDDDGYDWDTACIGKVVGKFLVNISRDGLEKDRCVIVCQEDGGDYSIYYEVSRQPYPYDA